MGLFDKVGSVLNTVGAVSNSLGITGALGTAGKLAGALNNLSNPAAMVSALRSINVSPGANPDYKKSLATASMGGDAESSDWRVRLSIPQNANFRQSPVLAPLINAGGLIFPYTPTIQMQGSAAYENTPITHQNYSYFSYTNSQASSVSISGPFNVEDAIQAQYWIAAVHYLRSVTKMFTGDSQDAGNPPPMVYLNGYGDYVFKDIPVIITSFTVELPQDVAYIATTVGASGPTSGFGSATGGANQTVENTANLLGVMGGVAGFMGSSKAASALGKAAGAMSIVNGLANMKNGAMGGSGTPFNIGGKTHVPVKSTISVVCQPVWSRNKTRTFNLDTFVKGGYVDTKPGYL